MEKNQLTTLRKSDSEISKENRSNNSAHLPTMRLPALLKKKRQYKSEDAITANINDNSGLRSPKASPRRTPKKRKSKAHNASSCRRVLDVSSLSLQDKFPEDDTGSTLVTASSKKEASGEDTDPSSPPILEHVPVKGDALQTIVEEQSVPTDEEKEIEIIKIHDTPTEEVDDKKADDIDEGYFDLSYNEADKTAPENNAQKASSPTAEKQPAKETSDACTTTATVADKQDSIVDLLNTDFQSKLQIGVAIQTESEPKRRKVSKACQITDEAVNTLNKKLLNLRNKMNKRLVESEDAQDKSTHLKKKCSELDNERLSLLAQTEALQYECVRKMHDNDQLNLKIEQKECHISTLKETLLLRDKEIHLLHRQPSSAGLSQQLTDYRELEVLRIDNIRLLHDNRALTGTLDALNGQLCALRRISRSYDECGDDGVILMNKRLAQDNSTLTCTLSTVKRELRSVNQDREDVVEQLRYLRSSCKRTAAERDALEKQQGNSVTQDNEDLLKQNSEMKQAVSRLQEEVDVLHSELNSTRNTHLAFDRALEEKSALQRHAEAVEERNTALWEEVEALRGRAREQSNAHEKQKHESNILAGENEELRKTNDTLFSKTETLKTSLNEEIEKNAAMAQKIHELSSSLSDATMSIEELKSTMEFLQVEHSFIQSDVEKKNDSISGMVEQIEQLKKSKQELVSKCKGKLKEKTKKLNASRIKLGYALLEMRDLNSHGSSYSSSSSA